MRLVMRLVIRLIIYHIFRPIIGVCYILLLKGAESTEGHDERRQAHGRCETSQTHKLRLES